MKKFAALFSLLVASAALGAAGDALYRVTKRTTITGIQAQCYATCARNQGAWDGAMSDVSSLTVEKRKGQFEVTCTGVFRAPFSSVPLPATIEARE